MPFAPRADPPRPYRELRHPFVANVQRILHKREDLPAAALDDFLRATRRWGRVSEAQNCICAQSALLCGRNRAHQEIALARVDGRREEQVERADNGAGRRANLCAEERPDVRAEVRREMQRRGTR